MWSLASAPREHAPPKRATQRVVDQWEIVATDTPRHAVELGN
jgi:hypothetical protein